MNEFQKGLVTGNYDLVGKFIEMFELDANEYEDALAVWLCEAACNWKDESVPFRKYAKSISALTCVRNYLSVKEKMIGSFITTLRVYIILIERLLIDLCRML